MSSPYIGEIRIFAGNFAPQGWALCEGQTLAIAEYDTLFNLIGTTYGGDGQNTFNLPDLRGRLPINMGNGFALAANGGVETVALTAQQTPAHTHPFLASTAIATTANITGSVLAEPSVAFMFVPAAGGTNMNATAISSDGGSRPHTNFQPYLCVNFIISLFGIYPSPT